ncbi:MAG: hypothetical protein P1S60_15470, partial [Anaerolineae bacterium]|nr:hypothetical protein [Anaerolineae bacterium]
MNRLEWRTQIMQLPVFDTHTHLNIPGVPIPAQNIWDIVHYFWFQQELWSVGYPRNVSKLDEQERTLALVEAFNATRNTTWNHIVRQMLSDLYQVDLLHETHIDEQMIHRADQAIRWFSWQPDWSQDVVDKLNIQRICVNNLAHANFSGLPGVSIVVPVWEDSAAWQDRIVKSSDKKATCEAAAGAIKDFIRQMYNEGIRGIRIEADLFDVCGAAAVNYPAEIDNPGSEAWEAEAFLIHTQLKELSEYNMFAQLFLGIKRDVTTHTAMAVDDPLRIITLYPLFERYTCGFELVVGAPANNMDAAQAARIYPNVFLGGLWWYNFRPSTYEHAMQVRFEAVP